MLAVLSADVMPWHLLMMQAPSIDWKGAQAGRFGPGGYLGVTSVPLPGSSGSINRGRADAKQQQEASLQVAFT